MAREPEAIACRLPRLRGGQGRATREAHRLYQLADYDGAAQLLPALLTGLDRQARNQGEQSARTTAAAHIAAAKLATKQADAGLA